MTTLGLASDPKSLGDLLRLARISAGFTQEQVARELGITQAYVSELESGKESRALTRVFEFLRLTGVTLHAESGVSTTSDTLVPVDLSGLEEACRRYGIAELSVFGSVARGAAGEGSDIDLLYTLSDGAQLGWAINDLSDELEQLFGRPVDLVSKKSLHPRMRDDVLRQARIVYAT